MSLLSSFLKNKEVWVTLFTKRFYFNGFSQMKIEIIRAQSTDVSLNGKLFIDGVQQCFTLERPYNDPDHRPIPEGEYPIRMRDSAFWSQHGYKQVPGIFDVPGRTDIEIHPANWARELKGCMAVGQAIDGDTLLYSRAAFAALLIKLGDIPNSTKILIRKEIV